MKKNIKTGIILNHNNEEKKIGTVVLNSFKDDGKGTITFKNGLTITDSSPQWNGTKYDIESMEIGTYKGQVTADHVDAIENVIARASGVEKVGNRVIVKQMRFAINENPLALLAYNMVKGGYITDVSIETIGPWPDDEGIYYNAKLVGLSIVVIGNNKSAHMNDAQFQKLVQNSIKQSEEQGQNVEMIKKELCYNKKQESIVNNSDTKKPMYVTIKNSRSFAVEVSFKNAAGEEVKKTLAAGESVDVSEDQKTAVETQINSAVEKVDLKEEIKKTVNEILAPVVEDLKKTAANTAVKEPGFKKTENKNEKYDYKASHGKQIRLAWDAFKNGDNDARAKLVEINKLHLEKLQEEGMVENTITLGDMGNFVISPELLRDIQGFRSDFSPLISRLNFQETLSLQMAWLERSGDINMQEVEMCDDGEDGNLKPISEYSASIKQSNLHELAAVTPVCDAATRFLAADLLGDVAAGYRTDFDRKRAQLFIARLQQAVNQTNNKVSYNLATQVAGLQSFIDLMSRMVEEIPNGTFIFSYQSYGQLLRNLVGAGISGPLAGVFTTGDQAQILGRPYIIVPNELMPALKSAGTKSFTVEGQTVTINQGAFYTDLTAFKGRTSGGLKYDLSTEAAYEVNGEVKSAFQRNELVLRGSFFRGGAITDPDKVVSMGAAAIS